MLAGVTLAACVFYEPRATLVTAWIFFTCYAIGRLLRKKLGFQPSGFAEEVSLSTGIGLGALMCVLFAMGLCGWYYAWAFALLLGAAGLLAYREFAGIWLAVRGFHRAWSETKQAGGWQGVLLTGVLPSIFFLLTLPIAIPFGRACGAERFSVLAALDCYLRWQDSGRFGWLRLGVFFLAMGAGAKPTVVFGLVSLGPLYLHATWRRPRRLRAAALRIALPKPAGRFFRSVHARVAPGPPPLLTACCLRCPGDDLRGALTTFGPLEFLRTSHIGQDQALALDNCSTAYAPGPRRFDCLLSRGVSRRRSAQPKSTATRTSWSTGWVRNTRREVDRGV